MAKEGIDFANITMSMNEARPLMKTILFLIFFSMNAFSQAELIEVESGRFDELKALPSRSLFLSDSSDLHYNDFRLSIVGNTLQLYSSREFGADLPPATPDLSIYFESPEQAVTVKNAIEHLDKYNIIYSLQNRNISFEQFRENVLLHDSETNQIFHFSRSEEENLNFFRHLINSNRAAEMRKRVKYFLDHTPQGTRLRAEVEWLSERDAAAAERISELLDENRNLKAEIALLRQENERLRQRIESADR